jgi:repressor LexA
MVALFMSGEETTVQRIRREYEVAGAAPTRGHEDRVVPLEELRVQGRVVYVIHPSGS